MGIASCGKKEFADASVNAIVPHPASIDTLDNGAFLLDGSAAVVYKIQDFSTCIYSPKFS